MRVYQVFGFRQQNAAGMKYDEVRKRLTMAS